MTQMTLSHAISLAIGAVMSAPWDFGGIIWRARSGPVSDQVSADLVTHYGPATRVHAAMDQTALMGGVDPIASLIAGKMVTRAGLLSGGKWIGVSMAERLSGWMAAALADRMDAKTLPPTILWDQGIDDEGVADILTDRCAFRFDLNDLSLRDFEGFTPIFVDHAAMTAVAVTDDQIHTITEIAERGGIIGLRSPIQTVRLCKFIACVDGRATVNAQDIETAVQLVLGHRLRQTPEIDEHPQDAHNEPDPAPDTPQDQEITDAPPLEDMLIDAVTTNLPAFLLAPETRKSPIRSGGAYGAGQRQKSNSLGRPKPPISGRPHGGQRVDIVATLTAAAPWQKIRRNLRPDHPAAFVIFPQDIKIKRYEMPSERLIIFGVDASGSAALARLAEAKGAVEIMLAEAYANRDFVALVGFRGERAEILLPPTRSLTMAKKSLAGFAGGGGTPLASGLECALNMAMRSLRQGRTPTLAFLTDGKANITLAGDPDRTTAAKDAEAQAEFARHLGVNALFIDVGRRPNADLDALSHKMGARYVPLPRADAKAVSSIVAQTLTSV